MTHAEWTVSEETEIARDRREGFVLSKEFFLRATPQTTMVLVGGAIFTAAVLHVMSSPYGAFDPSIFFAVAVFSLGSIPLARFWERRQEARHETEPEMKAALGHDGRLVSIIVRQGDAPTGEDRGILWFESGKLYFSGRRTSFGLLPEQVSGSATFLDSSRDVRHRINLDLQTKGPIGTVSISLAPFVSSLTNPDMAAGQLRAELNRWKKGRSSGTGQWPPLDLGPCVVSERRLFFRAFFTTFTPPSILAAVLWSSNVAVAAILFGIGLSFCAFYPSNALVWRAWRARRKLRRLS